MSLDILKQGYVPCGTRKVLMVSLEEAYEIYDKNGLASYYHNGLIWTVKEENRG